ncbi:MAG: hypothetical protein WC868_08230 [Bacteroidales bacterium]
MKKIVLIFFLILFGNMLFAQNLKDSIKPKTDKFKKNAVFVELGGSSYFGTSINYNRNIYINKNISLSGSLGVGLSGTSGKVGSMVIPVRVTFNWKRLEFGFGFSNCLNYFGSQSDDLNIDYMKSLGGFKYKYGNSYRIYFVNPHPIIGYNLLNKKNYFLCASLSTLIVMSREEGHFIIPWFGISTGLIF